VTFAGLVYRLDQGRQRTVFALLGAAFFWRLCCARAKPRPRISGVVVGRNDDYMPDFRQRLLVTIDWNLRYLLDEVIFVEWNPLPDREPLSFSLAKRFARLKAYIVAAPLHEDIGGNAEVPVLEFHAKNVGIRRASCPWIVATNADALFGFDSVWRLRHSPLSPDVAWTAQRVDIPWREGRSSRARLPDVLWYRRVIPDHPLGTGEFLFASQQLWDRARGYDEFSTAHRIGVDKRGTAQLLACGATAQKAGVVLHLAHPTSCTEAVRPHHGEWATLEGVPYANPATWGLADRREVERAERVWSLM
jgi:hypothetical protein